MRTGDTDRMQAGGGSASARSMRLGSWVIAKAADAIVDKGRRIAGAMLEAAEQNIEHCFVIGVAMWASATPSTRTPHHGRCRTWPWRGRGTT
jgi:Molybdopterin-binding domain of aldehyde dehydrogenase